MIKPKQKNQILLLVYAFMIGAIAGLFIWTFLRLMNICIDALWKIIPNNTNIPYYTIIICTIGGLIIGIFRKKIGDYPEDLNTVMKKIKKDGRYSYKNIMPISIAAILPLIFGASVGPEAGLTGVIAGLCTWIGDKLKKLGKEFQELTKMGLSATLGTIFNSPLFGFVEPLESKNENITFPKKSKTILYLATIIGAMGIFLILKNIFGGESGLESFTGFEATKKEWIFLLPLILIGTLASFLYYAFEKTTTKITEPIKNHTILISLTAGLILGLFGTLLPLTMFSGEKQMIEVMETYQSLGISILLLTGILKLLLTNICIHMGLKGGHFFPVIFSGICIGYALSLLLNINPIFSVTVITTSLVASIMQKPLATVLLLMICFPSNAIFIMLISAVISSEIKIPKILKES